MLDVVSMVDDRLLLTSICTALPHGTPPKCSSSGTLWVPVQFRRRKLLQHTRRTPFLLQDGLDVIAAFRYGGHANPMVAFASHLPPHPSLRSCDIHQTARRVARKLCSDTRWTPQPVLPCIYNFDFTHRLCTYSKAVPHSSSMTLLTPAISTSPVRRVEIEQ